MVHIIYSGIIDSRLFVFVQHLPRPCHSLAFSFTKLSSPSFTLTDHQSAGTTIPTSPVIACTSKYTVM